MVKVAASAGDAEYAVAVRAGDLVFREGDAAGPLFVIEDGQVELVQGPEAHRLALLGSGDVFGEVSLLEDRPRECAAKAITDLKLLKVDRGGLDALLRQSPEAATSLLRRLARRLQEARTAALPAPTPRLGKIVHEGGTEFALPESAAVVGRAAKGHVPDIDLSPVDTERSLSRRHATLWREGAQYYVREEAGVANGTFVNRKRLKAGEPVPLAEGDQVVFGLVKTTFHLI